MARFRYEFVWKVDFEKLEFTHSDRQHFKNLRAAEELRRKCQPQTKEPGGGRRDSQHSGGGKPHRAEKFHRAQENAQRSVQRASMETEMSVHEDYWPYDSQEKLNEAIADAKSYWISQGYNPQAHTDEQRGRFLKKKLKETKQLRARV